MNQLEPRRRSIQIGGLNKELLLARLAAAGVQLNEHARTLFAHPRFTTSPAVSTVEITELSVADLGFKSGATMGELFASAAKRGLVPCPLELAAQFRLQYLDQPEGALGFPTTQHRAPPGSLTVASLALTKDDGTLDNELPRGFYLRRIEGVLWMRGYSCDGEHVWNPEDRWVFASAAQQPEA